MPTSFTETLHSWQNFYFMIGGVAAALLGLMFVAVSLGMHLPNQSTSEGIDTFTTPNIVYFVSVILIASVMLIPDYTVTLFYAILLIGMALGLGLAIYFVRRLYLAGLRNQDFNKEDWFWLCIMPIVSYIVLLVAAICFAVGQWSIAFTILFAGTLSLLMTAIANTWGLVIWIIYARRD
jgi:hypothetical protein